MIKLKKVKEGNYDHSIESDMKACGVDVDSFTEANGKMNGFIDGLNKDNNMVSELAEGIESVFSKRQLAFMVSKMTLVMMLQEAQKQDAAKSEEE
tara:strand:- start:831 stop:1115 length:285 start_codon:yes stop_codon:yes gene_type:complete